jgi:hypothetical protein
VRRAWRNFELLPQYDEARSRRGTARRRSSPREGEGALHVFASVTLHARALLLTLMPALLHTRRSPRVSKSAGMSVNSVTCRFGSVARISLRPNEGGDRARTVELLVLNAREKVHSEEGATERERVLPQRPAQDRD